MEGGFMGLASLVVQLVKNPLANAKDTKDLGSISGLGRSLEKEMETSILAWKIPWIEELVGYSPWVTESDTTEHTHPCPISRVSHVVSGQTVSELSWIVGPPQKSWSLEHCLVIWGNTPCTLQSSGIGYWTPNSVLGRCPQGGAHAWFRMPLSPYWVRDPAICSHQAP